MSAQLRRLDWPCDPLAALRAAADLPGVSLLQSGLQAYGLGRYSILAACPWKTFDYRGGVASVVEGGSRRAFEAELFAAFEREMAEGAAPLEAVGMPFCGGPIGYFAYEAGRHIEPTAGWSQSEAYEARFHFYRGAVVFDHGDGSVYFSGAEGELPLETLGRRVAAGSGPKFEPFGLACSLSANFTQDEFMAAVSRAQDYIREGDVYQINLSQRFAARCSGSPLELFLRLAVSNASPYAAYLDFGDEQIVCTSPERFLLVDGGLARTRPIKGTRPAGRNETEARANELELAASEKDRAELLMIVDLERNDLGRVCRPGSIRVEGLFAAERYATVVHQTAEVVGVLEADRTALDCLRALFPGGSITGAPKVRAMQLIAELERGPRGIYTGAIGYFDATGRADFNIAIRTLRVAQGSLSFQVGAGIVWDSDADSEYRETLWKGQAFADALGASLAPTEACELGGKGMKR